MKQFYVYIMTNLANNILYTGVTNNLIKRVYEHKSKLDKNCFTARYNLTKLVYFEVFADSYNAISREKQIKAGNRRNKLKLIDGFNNNWVDLYAKIIANQ